MSAQDKLNDLAGNVERAGAVLTGIHDVLVDDMDHKKIGVPGLDDLTRRRLLSGVMLVSDYLSRLADDTENVEQAVSQQEECRYG